MWVGAQQPSGGQHHSGRAEAALQTVLVHESLLNGIELAVLFQALDSSDLVPARHCGEHGAALDRRAINLDNTDAAVGRIAAPMGTRQAELVPQEVHKQHPRFDLANVLIAIYLDRDLHINHPSCPRQRAIAVRSARLMSSPARARL